MSLKIVSDSPFLNTSAFKHSISTNSDMCLTCFRFKNKLILNYVGSVSRELCHMSQQKLQTGEQQQRCREENMRK